MQQRHNKGNILIMVLILLAVAVVFVVLLIRGGKLDSYFGKQPQPSVSEPVQSQDDLSKSDEVEDIEKDLNTTNLSETDKVLGEVDVQLNAK